ncbi:MAG: CoB--CoM heterodisulfide reductase iron-sulfur subunit A family protein [Candidatus Aminicenantes bacterium]|nr:CoB--CoM heterodisulfide reductase iron-sulfur subunit A family protein [Candidatus Aminicenantes bacterium]
MGQTNVLVIGAGLSGMKASLLLADAGVHVYLMEKDSLIGGQTIKFEEVYPNMECATCMVAPVQQEVLHHKNIDLLLLSELEHVEGKAGQFKVKIHKKARYVSLVNCIGCGACYDPCPVSIDNPFEEGLSKQKAISVSCAGAIPNVPAIDPYHCLHLSGKDASCTACKESCMFDAIDFTEKEEKLDLEVGTIIVATGFDLFDVRELSQYGYGKYPNVYSAMEFERLYAQNGPTEGELILRNDRDLKSIAIIHCVGRNEMGYCSAVCCMYSAKFAHFLKHKVPKAQIHEFYTDLCLPGKSHQKFYDETCHIGVNFIHNEDIRVEEQSNNLQIRYKTGNGGEQTVNADMVILSPAMVPKKDTEHLSKILGIGLDKHGFFSTRNDRLSPVTTEKEGVFVIGCAEGPKDIPDSISQSEAAAGRALSILQEMNANMIGN